MFFALATAAGTRAAVVVVAITCGTAVAAQAVLLLQHRLSRCLGCGPHILRKLRHASAARHAARDAVLTGGDVHLRHVRHTHDGGVQLRRPPGDVTCFPRLLVFHRARRAATIIRQRGSIVRLALR